MSESDGARLAVMETLLVNLSNRLIGPDGTGGELDSLDKRVVKLENWRFYVVGIGIGLGIALGAGLRAIAEKLLN